MPSEIGKTLVTGAAGFVGAELCRQLNSSGRSVIAAHRGERPSGDFPAARVIALTLSAEPERWQSALDGVECVVHLAARVHHRSSEPGSESAFVDDNALGSRFVAEQAARAGVRRLVYVSSVKVNGEGDSSRPYRASDPPRPSDAYARSKLAAETAIHAVSAASRMELVIIRPPLVYGPGVRANFRRLLRLAHSGLPLPLASIQNRRSLLGLWNLADFIRVCLDHPGAAGKIWMVSDGEDESTPGLIRRLARLMGRPARLFRFPPAALRAGAALIGLGAEAARLCDSLQVDASPAREQLGWTPPIGLEQGLARTAAAYVASLRS